MRSGDSGQSKIGQLCATTSVDSEVLGTGKKHFQSARIADAYFAVGTWTSNLLAEFFAHCKDPERAATAYCNRRMGRGDLNSCVLPAIFPPKHGVELLHVLDQTNNGPPIGQLVWLAEKYFRQPAEPVRVWWPTRQFGRRHGATSWLGRDSLSAGQRNAISHELLCAATWLSILKTSPMLALESWTPEAEIQHHARRNKQRGALPDGLIRQGDHVTAVEVLGRYSTDYLEHKCRSFSHYDRVEIWGVKR